MQESKLEALPRRRARQNESKKSEKLYSSSSSESMVFLSNAAWPVDSWLSWVTVQLSRKKGARSRNAQESRNKVARKSQVNKKERENLCPFETTVSLGLEDFIDTQKKSIFQYYFVPVCCLNDFRQT